MTSTPGTFEGAQIPFKSILCQQISAFKQENPDFDFDNETLTIKISGDGAKMTQKTDYILHPYHFSHRVTPIIPQLRTWVLPVRNDRPSHSDNCYRGFHIWKRHDRRH